MSRNTVITAIILSITMLLVMGCGSTNKNVRTGPTIDVVETSLSRDIEDKGPDSIPIGKSSIYYTNDTEVVSYIKVANISGKHKVRWDWYRPDGKLYCSTGSETIKIKSGKFKREMAIWHRITLDGEKAVGYPGRWLVDVYFDNEIVSSNHFEIKTEINVDKMPKFASAQNQSNWGLIIGIENYADLPSVTYAQKDAMLMQEYYEKIIGIPEENIITLIDSEATKAKIEGLLKSYLPLNLNSDTTLYVYFAGHGVPSLEDGDSYIVTYDGDPRFIEHTGYKLKTLYSDIDALPIKRSVVFIDGCFSGASSRSNEMLLAGSRPALIKVEDMVFPSNKIVSLTASKGDQISNAYPEKEHGLFSYFVFSGLRGPADSNQDNKITLDELYTYVNGNVVKVSRRGGMEQTPVILPGREKASNIQISKVIEE